MQRGRRVALIDRDPNAGNSYDCVIIDTPSAIIDLVEDGISQANFVLIPSRISALDITALGPVVDLCREHKKNYAFVLNAVHPHELDALWAELEVLIRLRVKR